MRVFKFNNSFLIVDKHITSSLITNSTRLIIKDPAFDLDFTVHIWLKYLPSSSLSKQKSPCRSFKISNQGNCGLMQDSTTKLLTRITDKSEFSRDCQFWKIYRRILFADRRRLKIFPPNRYVNQMLYNYMSNQSWSNSWGSPAQLFLASIDHQSRGIVSMVWLACLQTNEVHPPLFHCIVQTIRPRDLACGSNDTTTQKPTKILMQTCWFQTNFAVILPVQCRYGCCFS